MSSKKRRETVRETSASSWKERIRQSCLKRIQDQRAELLSKFRSGQAVPRTELRQIISKEASQPSHGSEGCFGPDELPQGKQTCAPELHEMSGEEYETFMSELEATLFEELEREQLQFVEDTELDEIAEAFLTHCTFNPHAKPLDVVCPVCNRANIVESRPNHITCAFDQYCIEVPVSSANAPSLAVLVQDHLDKALARHTGCRHRPVFVAASVGLPALYLECRACGHFENVF